MNSNRAVCSSSSVRCVSEDRRLTLRGHSEHRYRNNVSILGARQCTSRPVSYTSTSSAALAAGHGGHVDLSEKRNRAIALRTWADWGKAQRFMLALNQSYLPYRRSDGEEE